MVWSNRRVYNESSLMVLLYTVHETKFKDGKKWTDVINQGF